MMFPGFPGVLSFFQFFQVEWEPWYYDVWRKIQIFSPVSYKSMDEVIFFLKPMVFIHFHKTFLFKQFGSFALGKQTKQWYKRVLVIPDRQCLYAFALTEVLRCRRSFTLALLRFWSLLEGTNLAFWQSGFQPTEYAL